MRSDTRVLSNVWWPVRVEDAANRKGDRGLVELHSRFADHSGPADQHKERLGCNEEADLEELPVLDVRQLPEVRIKAMAELHDKMVEAEFERLPGMANCLSRRSLDAGISRILGLPDLGMLRTLLASEPVVSNRRL